MRFKIFTSLLALALITCASVVVLAQDEDEAVRGSFLTTRHKSSSNSGSTSASSTITSAANQVTAKPSNKPTSGRSSGGSSTSRTGGTVSVKGSTGKTSASVKAGGSLTTTTAPASAYSPSAIGLGYTIYMRDASGSAVRVDPTQEFHAGDRIRLALESNTDGYLYIFHTENDGNPEMLYPDVRLEKGANRIQAHVPYEIPWNEPGVENWFKFDETPATERLYIVISRQPLPSIPVGEQLVDYCAKNSCPWHPRVEDWAKVKLSVQAKVGVVKSSSYGQKQTTTEREATTRGLGLDQSAPEPSVIRMNASSNAPVLVTAVDLIHK